MTYIPKDGKWSPGSLLGDAKSMNMRTVPYEVDSENKPVWNLLGVGSVVYLDENGYAVPYDRGSQAKSKVTTPYGVVWKMTMVDQNAPKYATNAPLVTIVTNGVIGVEYKKKDEKSYPPREGHPVNEYGCLADGNDEDEHIIGICDGVGTDPNDSTKIVVAARLLPKGTTLEQGSYPYEKYVKVYNDAKKGVNDDDGTIPAYAPVRVVQSADPDGLPSVKLWTTEAQQFYGYATEEIPPGETGRVIVGGPIDLPYVYVDRVANKNAVTRGYQVAWVPNGYGGWDKVWVFIRNAATVVGDVCNAMILIANAKKAWNSAGRITEDKKKPEPALGKTTVDGKGDEPVIDGWLTVDVNPQFIHAPMSLDYAVLDENATPIPGHIYGGTDSGVEEFKTNWDGMPFFGVCTGLPVEEGKMPFLRDGAVDVVAADNWNAGDYIDYTRHSIPEAYEQFLPHIGVAAADTQAGELGAVHLNPYDPNEYIILDHLALPECEDYSEILNTSVYLDGNVHLVACPPDGASIDYPTMQGILRRVYPNYDPVHEHYVYGDRAIIQVGGYAWCHIEPEYGFVPGTPVRSMGATWLHPAFGGSGLDSDPACVQLGEVVSEYTSTESIPNTHIVKLDIRHRPKWNQGDEPTDTNEYAWAKLAAGETATVGQTYHGTTEGVTSYLYGATVPYISAVDPEPFFGVLVSDSPDSDGYYKFCRRGVTNVIPRSTFQAHTVLDMAIEPILSPDHAPYVPTLGETLEDATAVVVAAGDLVKCRIDPHDPNKYEVLDHVEIDSSIMELGYPFDLPVCLRDGVLMSVDAFTTPPTPLHGLVGVLVWYHQEYYDEDARYTYRGRAIVQTGGYHYKPDSDNYIGGSIVTSYKAKEVRGIQIAYPGTGIDPYDCIQLGTIVELPSIFGATGNPIHFIHINVKDRSHPITDSAKEDIKIDVKNLLHLIIGQPGPGQPLELHFKNDSDHDIWVQNIPDEFWYPHEVGQVDFQIDVVPANDVAASLTYSGDPISLISVRQVSQGQPDGWYIDLTENVPDQWVESITSPRDAFAAYDLRLVYAPRSNETEAIPLAHKVITMMAPIHVTPYSAKKTKKHELKETKKDLFDDSKHELKEDQGETSLIIDPSEP